MNVHFLRISFILSSIFYQLCLFGQTPLELDISEDVVTPKVYQVTRSTSEIKIDGHDHDAAWSKANYSDSFIDIEGEKIPKYDTKMKMLWDEEFLYVFARLEEPHIWGDIKTRDEVIFYNNDFEVFIDPDGDTKNYGEIEINALNTVWDLYLSKPYRSGGIPINSWNLDDMKTAVQINGSLNDHRDIDEYWSVEMAIPMKALKELKNKKADIDEGEIWRINFSRVQWQHELMDGIYQRKKVDGKYLPEFNWVWSNQNEINMHAPEKWGYLVFTNQTNVENITNPKIENIQLEQTAFALYRNFHFGKWKNLTSKIDSRQKIKAKISEKDYLHGDVISTGRNNKIELTSHDSTYLATIDHLGNFSKKLIPKSDFTLATWANGSENLDELTWVKKLEEYKNLGVSEILVGGSPEFLSDLVKLANQYNIKVHAWIWTLNKPNDEEAQKHPEWYSVNREGKNSLEYRAYVDYYQWLSPFHPEAREHIKNNIRKLTKVEGLASIHLDYVRYVDVILGADLQPKYNLKQTSEMPQFDYGYHPIAREGFKKLFGIDPIEMEHPELSTEWRQYRLNAVTTLVNELADIAHAEGIHLTAAVFPFPEMSRQMVRQAWNDWNLDAAFPMLYQNFYRQNISWIGFAAEQGINMVDFPIYAGLFEPAFSTPQELRQAIQLVKEKGSKGVSIFTIDGMSEEMKEILKEEFNPEN